MGSFLFLKGNSGEGKTTLLFECLKPWHKTMGGFYSQRLTDESGITMGFRMIPSEEDWIPKAFYKEELLNMFIERTGNGWKKNLKTFQTVGIEFLHPAKERKLCLMDEIGGVELFVPEFMETVWTCLDSSVPCIGVLKSRRNLETMSARVPTQPESDRLLQDLEAKLKKRSNGRILTFERGKEDSIRAEILEFLKVNM